MYANITKNRTGQPIYKIGSRLSDIHGCPDRLATIIHLLVYHIQRTAILLNQRIHLSTDTSYPYSVICLCAVLWVVACDLCVFPPAELVDFMV
jgi:hypothetical protein